MLRSLWYLAQTAERKKNVPNVDVRIAEEQCFFSQTSGGRCSMLWHWRILAICISWEAIWMRSIQIGSIVSVIQGVTLLPTGLLTTWQQCDADCWARQFHRIHLAVNFSTYASLTLDWLSTPLTEMTREDSPPAFSGSLPTLPYDSDHLAILIRVKINAREQFVLPQLPQLNSTTAKQTGNAFRHTLADSVAKWSRLTVVTSRMKRLIEKSITWMVPYQNQCKTLSQNKIHWIHSNVIPRLRWIRWKGSKASFCLPYTIPIDLISTATAHEFN